MSNDPGCFGDLMMFHTNGHARLSLTERGNNRGDNSVLPSLHEVHCIGLMGDHLIFRGLQKPRMKNPAEEAPAFLQEWRITVLEI